MIAVGAVVLAAGEASRFGSPKQQLLLPCVLDRLAGKAAEIVVVAGAHPVEAEANVVQCADWAKGPGASLRCGLAALGGSIDAAVVVLADGPELAPAAIDRVVEAWRAGTENVVAASYGGERGHPLVLGRAAWADVPDAGLRDAAVRLVPCDDLGAPGDVDRPEDLPERLRRRG
jgi:nicotine blue oxidoreductase